MNVVVLSGRIAQEMELRTKGEVKYIQLSLAVNDFRAGAEVADFFEIVVWGKRATALHKFRKKGDEILVRGRLRPEVWQNEAGETKRKVRVHVDHMEFLRRSTANAAADLGDGEAPF